MKRHIFLVAGVVLIGCGVVSAAPPRNAPPKKAETPPVGDFNRISLEVQALQALHRLHLTARQLEALSTLANGTATSGERQPAKISERLAKTLVDLRDALRKGSEDERIDELTTRLTELKENEESDLDDDVELSDAARERANELFRLLKPRQVAAYLDDPEEEVHDPVDRIVDTVRRKDKLTPTEWTGAVKLASLEVGWLVAGVDKDRGEKISSKVAELLERSARLSEAELEKAARHIVGEPAPTDLLRNAMTHALAELLSNPELPAALKARTGSSK